MLTVIKPGIYTTIQDTGRFFGSHLGIPMSGSMDRKSADLANLSLGNKITDAVLECTFLGPTLKFHTSTHIAIKGAQVQALINEIEVNIAYPLKVHTEDILSFGKLESGCRFYIAIKGGILSDPILNSRSTCHTAGILKPLIKGDQFSYNETSKPLQAPISLKRVLGNHILSVVRGPEFSILSKSQLNQLLATKFIISPQSNRMAYRVKHDVDLSHSHSIISSATLPGTIQLTPSGEIICLMRDTQTTGGYPRIFQMSEDSICDLSQLSPNEGFELRMTN